MFKARTISAIALLGILAGAAARADHRSGSGDYYPSGPQVRLGIDVIWGGSGYVAPRPPVAWYPAYYEPYPVYYQPYPVYRPAYAPHYAPRHGHPRGDGHRKRHRHRH